MASDNDTDETLYSEVIRELEGLNWVSIVDPNVVDNRSGATNIERYSIIVSRAGSHICSKEQDNLLQDIKDYSTYNLGTKGIVPKEILYNPGVSDLHLIREVSKEHYHEVSIYSLKDVVNAIYTGKDDVGWSLMIQ